MMLRQFNYPKPCAQCGKPARKDTEHYWGSEPYKGNLKVLRSKEHNFGGNKKFDLVLWDGETYFHRCGHFCTNRCAQRFANEILEIKGSSK